MLRLLRVCFINLIYGYVISVTTTHDTLITVGMGNNKTKIRHLWETLSASFGHYALILLMSPRSDHSCYLF